MAGAEAARRATPHHAPTPLTLSPRAAAETGVAPRVAFPFVQLFGANAHGALEAVVTILLRWAAGWFEAFPGPPVSLLRRFMVSVALPAACMHMHVCMHSDVGSAPAGFRRPRVLACAEPSAIDEALFKAAACPPPRSCSCATTTPSLGRTSCGRSCRCAPAHA